MYNVMYGTPMVLCMNCLFFLYIQRDLITKWHGLGQVWEGRLWGITPQSKALTLLRSQIFLNCISPLRTRICVIRLFQTLSVPSLIDSSIGLAISSINRRLINKVEYQGNFQSYVGQNLNASLVRRSFLRRAGELDSQGGRLTPRWADYSHQVAKSNSSHIVKEVPTRTPGKFLG